MGAELSIAGVSDYEEIKDQVLTKVRRRPPTATESGPEMESSDEKFVSEEDVGANEELAELRRIRELLEREFTG